MGVVGGVSSIIVLRQQILYTYLSLSTYIYKTNIILYTKNNAVENNKLHLLPINNNLLFVT